MRFHEPRESRQKNDRTVPFRELPLSDPNAETTAPRPFDPCRPYPRARAALTLFTLIEPNGDATGAVFSGRKSQGFRLALWCRSRANRF